MLFNMGDLLQVLTTLVWVTMLNELVLSQHSYSVCETMHYRTLTIKLQNEHQCMILEKLQRDFDKEKTEMRRLYTQMSEAINKFHASIIRNVQSMNIPSQNTAKAVPTLLDVPLVRDCGELLMNGITQSGVYPIRLPNRNIVNVWCDMETESGGWTVLQRRLDGSVNFARGWDDYASGFGNVNTEYWLGNENLHWLSTLKNYTLRIDLWDWEGNRVYAMYDTFQIESEKNKYKLRLGKYSGTAGDAMTPYHDNMEFSTLDEDNDEWSMHCAKKDQSGWWFRACGFASLNGLYIENGVVAMTPDGLIKGIIWFQWKNDYAYSMKRTEMKLKPSLQVKLDRQRMEQASRKTKESIITTTTDKTDTQENDNTTPTLVEIDQTQPEITEPIDTNTEQITEEQTTISSISDMTTPSYYESVYDDDYYDG
ncbi:Fibrinogen-like protein 1 [Mactra antiquata]